MAGLPGDAFMPFHAIPCGILFVMAFHHAVTPSTFHIVLCHIGRALPPSPFIVPPCLVWCIIRLMGSHKRAAACTCHPSACLPPRIYFSSESLGNMHVRQPCCICNCYIQHNVHSTMQHIWCFQASCDKLYTILSLWCVGRGQGLPGMQKEDGNVS